MKKVIFILALCIGTTLSSCKSDLEKHCGEKIISKSRIPYNSNNYGTNHYEDDDGQYYFFKLSFLSSKNGPDLESIYVSPETYYHYKEGEILPCK